MKIKCILMILCFSTIGQAFDRRHENAHEHGSGNLGIAFEGAVGKMDFKIPSESIFGFEHEAKTEKQKSAQKAGLKALSEKIESLIVFDPALKCKVSIDKVEVVREKKSSHSETVAAYGVKCDKSPLGTSIIFNFQKEYPKIKDLDVEVVVDNLQKSMEVKNLGAKLELK